MRLILLTWNYNGQEAAIRAFARLGYEVVRFPVDASGNIAEDPARQEALRQRITDAEASGDPVRFVFSHDYFPFVSDVCQELGVPYLSVVYDSPHYSLTAHNIGNPVNHVYVFDRGFIEELRDGGIDTLRPVVLSVDPEMADRAAAAENLPYEHEICFVGSLYRDAFTFYDQIRNMPPALAEYLDMAFAAQRKIFGVDLLGDPAVVPDKILDALERLVDFEMTGDYRLEPRALLRDMLRKKVTSLERYELLEALGSRFSVDLYTNPGSETPAGARNLGYADYNRDMPRIFNRSKINLNITLRTIRTGIPQRAMDIMACGGFLLSDYREELEEHFVEGEDLVMARTPEDFISLAEYYLQHDAEREAIAKSGQKKVLEKYTNDRLFAQMIP